MKDVKKKVLYGEGDRMFRKKLGRTLRRLSEDGVETFYRGDLARLIVEEIGKRGGLVSRRDLRDYRVDIRPSLRVNFSDSFEALSTSAPSSGPLLLFILNVLHGQGEKRIFSPMAMTNCVSRLSLRSCDVECHLFNCSVLSSLDRSV